VAIMVFGVGGANTLFHFTYNTYKRDLYSPKYRCIYHTPNHSLPDTNEWKGLFVQLWNLIRQTTNKGYLKRPLSFQIALMLS
jgi:hypothetical protein